MNLAEKIFGLDVLNTKGKWVKEKPNVVSNEDFIEIPPELDLAGKEMELAIDVVYINRECFLHTVDRTIKEPSCVTLGTYSKGEAPTSETLYKALYEVRRKYNRADVRISVLHADNEFRSLLEELIQSDEWDIDINFSNPGEHVPDIERGNRTLEERFRVQYYRLPFEALPRVMVRYLSLRITKTRSLFPKKEGILKYFSPHVLLKKQQINFRKEFEFSFGDYV